MEVILEKEMNECKKTRKVIVEVKKKERQKKKQRIQRKTPKKQKTVIEKMSKQGLTESEFHRKKKYLKLHSLLSQESFSFPFSFSVVRTANELVDSKISLFLL